MGSSLENVRHEMSANFLILLLRVGEDQGYERVLVSAAWSLASSSLILFCMLPMMF